jgi:hypothetical protein
MHLSSSTEVVVGSRTIFNVNQEFWQDSWQSAFYRRTTILYILYNPDKEDLDILASQIVLEKCIFLLQQKSLLGAEQFLM